MFELGELVYWYETYGDVMITKDSGIGIISGIYDSLGEKIFKVHRIKHKDTMSFDITTLEKVRSKNEII